jgi:hypothetical protein
MAKQEIEMGSGPLAGDGESLHTAFTKVNENFTELYAVLGLAADNTLNLGAFEFNGSVISTTDSTAIVIDQATTVTSDLTVGGDIIPSVANGGNLGSPAKPFRSLFVSNSTIFLGNVPLSLEPGTNELQINNVPISQRITYADIPNAPVDVSDLTDTGNLLGGGGGDTGDITFVNNIISAPDDDAIRIEAKDDNGDVRAYFKVDPADGQAEMRALSSPTRTNFSLADGDWVSAQWIANGGTGYLEFTNAPNILSYLVDAPSNLYIRINGGAPVSKGSGSGSDNDISVDTGSDFPPSTTVVTTVEFYYMDESRIEIDYDSDIDIYGDQLDISIESTESVYVQGRDVEISASGTLKLQNYADDQNIEIVTDGDNEQQTWVFDVDGSLTLPGDHKVFTGGDSELILLSLSGMTLGKGDPVELTYDSSVAIGDDVVINTNISGDDIRPWTFGADGNLTLPAGGDILDSTGASVLGSGGIPLAGATYNLNANAGLAINTTDGEIDFLRNGVTGIGIRAEGLHIYAANSYILWDGSVLKLPGGSDIQRNDGTGNFVSVLGGGGAATGIESETDVSIKVNLTDSTQRIWRFGEDGSLRLPIGVSIDDNVDPLYPKIIADSGKLFSVQAQGTTGSAALAWSVNPDAAGQYAAVAVSRGGGDNLAKVVLQAQSDSGDVATVKLWKFDETGALTLPAGDGSSVIQSVQQNGYQSKVTVSPLQILSQARRSQDQSYSIANEDFTTATSDGNGMITFVGLQGGVAEFITDTMENGVVYERTVRINGAGPEYQYASFNDTDDQVFLVTAAPAGAVTEIRFSYTRISKIDINPDEDVFRIESQPGLDIDLQAGRHLDIFAIDHAYMTAGTDARLRSGTGQITITTNHEVPNATPQVWAFGNNGSLIFPDSTVQTTAYTGYHNGDMTGSVFADDSILLVDGVNAIVPNSELAKSVTQVIDSNATINTSETITTNNSYTSPTNFVADVDPSLGFVIPGMSQRNSTEIEVNLFVDGSGAFRTYLLGLALGRTVIATYSTASGNQTFTSTISQVFSDAGGQVDPITGWGRITGRILGTVPAGYTGLVGINFPVYSTESHTWTFDSDGKLTVPGDIVGYQTYVSENPADERVTIQPSGSVDKPFLFTTDQTNGTWARSSMELPSAETNKAVTLGFPHNNITTGYIYNQGTDTLSGTEFNNAFNIMSNGTDVKISTVSGGGNKVWKFAQDGDITLPASGDVLDSTGVSQTAQREEGSWTVTAGTNTYSFTLPSDGTYTMWVKGNIPNGIIVWNATASVSNTNVPAIGTQYAWNYTGGGSPISLTSIPDQIKGTAGTISTDATYVGTTSNRFDFGISNTSGASQTVYYGYTKI